MPFPDELLCIYNTIVVAKQKCLVVAIATSELAEASKNRFRRRRECHAAESMHAKEKRLRQRKGSLRSPHNAQHSTSWGEWSEPFLVESTAALSVYIIGASLSEPHTMY